MMQRKQYSADVKALDADKGVVEAVVSVFNNVDLGQERILPGAFTASLERKLPKGVWSHDWDKPVAKTLEARELMPGDAMLPEAIRELGGLYIKGQFNLATQRGAEAYADLKFGLIDEFSIGYRVVKDSSNSETGVLDLVELELYEWSPVLVGMNPATQLISVKGEAPAAKTLDEEAEVALAAVEGLVDRLAKVKDLREAEGRALSEARRSQIAELRGKLAALEVVEPAPDPDPDASGVYARFLEIQTLARL